MAAVLPFEVEVCRAPQGHGYVDMLVDRPNPFFPSGTRLRGHEFHYSHIMLDSTASATACAVSRGMGCFLRTRCRWWTTFGPLTPTFARTRYHAGVGAGVPTGSGSGEIGGVTLVSCLFANSGMILGVGKSCPQPAF